jgi:DDE family transposase
VRYEALLYQAASWSTARRVVAKVEFHLGELFPRVGFIVTNLELPSRTVVLFYNKVGTVEPWIKEGKLAVNWTRLSCHRFRGNEVRLWLSVIAYNLGNLWRRLALPKRIRNWSLTSLQQRLVKTGGRLVKHARYYWLLLAEGASHARVFSQHAAKDRGTAAAERIANQEGQRIERSEVIQLGQLSAATQVGGRKQTTEGAGRARTSRDATQNRPCGF